MLVSTTSVQMITLDVVHAQRIPWPQPLSNNFLTIAK
jgi:hypothetical protein